ncbi:hypothetical protein BN1012_Phect1816 [Candidatus Phaeomarinobacter ectocarpi]|uniref:Uncharacterized protein n=1 Tax=Candidatus Phaeomarinibacter ectocarpi TaxID=1458461 RepID=X5MM35_9HYPH|nr:hypothetical protein [Candidatus Phaeomarinobacter ectocarpi]CDO60030.1 hypothetical protein BN1012_Phect1816 [Candidatus Phaeomarinobacter ectocarpi]
MDEHPSDEEPGARKPFTSHPNAKRDGYVNIRSELLTEMKERMQQLNRGAVSLLRERDDVPDDLKPGTIDRWFNRDHPGARADHLRYFLKVLREARKQPSQTTIAKRRNTLAGRLGLHEPGQRE